MVESSDANPPRFMMTTGTARGHIGTGRAAISTGQAPLIPVASSALSMGAVREKISVSKGQPAAPNQPKGIGYEDLIVFLSEQRPRQIGVTEQQDIRALLQELSEYILSGPFSKLDAGVLERKITRLQEQLGVAEETPPEY